MIRKLITCIGISLLVACSQEAEELSVPTDSIQFGVENVSDTRGIVISGETGSNPLKSMSVFCAYTDKQEYNPATSKTEWMHNVRVFRANVSDKWVVDNTYQPNAPTQWAGDGYHTFFAFAPYRWDGVSDLPKEGLPQLFYSVPTDHKSQEDILYSHKTLLNGKQMYIGSRPVNFGFSHALSKISFAAQKEIGMTDEVQINSINLTVKRYNGKLTPELTGSYPDMIRASWASSPDMPKTYILSVANDGLKKIAVTDSKFNLLHHSDSAFFMMPQPFQYETDNKLIVNYSIIKQGGSPINKILEVDLSKISGITQWEMGKAYRYSILIKDEKVIVTGTITDWVEKTIDGNIKATYLSLSESEVNISRGSERIIYYATDGTDISVKAGQGINFTHDPASKKITILKTTPAGKYILEVRADKITRKVKVTVI